MRRSTRYSRPGLSGSSKSATLLGADGDGSTLTLDFTTGQLDPRLTFTRNGGGTYIGNNGLVYGMDFATSSSLAIGTGSKSVTLTATAGVDRRYLVGQTVYISNGANNMSGPVTAYNASTQVLTINATATSGSGSFTSWAVGNASPRFDHDPTTLAPRGLLIEGTATSLFNYSEQFQQTSFWTSNLSGVTWPRATIVANTATAPDGNSTADTFEEIASTTGTHRCRSNLITKTANQVLTVSVFVKDKDRGFFGFRFADSGETNGCHIGFQLSGSGTVGTGTVFGSGYGTPTGTIVPVGTSGWYRATMTASTDALTTFGVYLQLQDSINNQSYTSGATALGVYVWGAQLETGSGASSYIPTGASQVTRNADECSMSSTNFAIGSWYTGTQGTLFTDVEYTALSGNQSGIQLADNSGSSETNRLSIRRNIAIATRANVTARQFAPTGTGRAKSAFTYGTADYRFAQNGSTFSAVAGDNGAPPNSIDRMRMFGPGPTQIYGWLRQIKFWPTSLPQATINTLTTL